MKTLKTRISFFFPALVALALQSPAAEARDALTLRVNDAIAPPEGLAAIVVRTYATKPISQGQLCFRARLGAARGARLTTGAAADVSDIFSAIEDVVVFAQRKDGVSAGSIELTADGPVLLIQFSSDSGTINSSDGPLAVIFARLRSDVAPRQEYEIEIDTANTAVFDAQGNPVRLAPRSGRLRIRHPGDPYEAEAEGDKVRPGQVAELGLETFEPVPIARAQIGLTYDPAIAVGRPKVKLSNRHGRRKFSVDRETPGVVIVSVRSPKARWNSVPGQIVSLKLRTSASARVGTRSLVRLDPGLTFFQDAEGDLLRYELEDGAIRFEDRRGDDDDD
jgi:hypothetical protein